MQEAHASNPTDRQDRSHASERKCLVTGNVQQKADLIRFVVGPDRTITPDLAQDLPGRGLWVSATHAALTSAAAKNLFSRAAKEQVIVPEGLVDLVISLLKRRVLECLGLAKRAGIAVLGQPQVEAALKARKIALLLLAADAGTDLNPLDAQMNNALSRDELGAALGHEQIVYAGFKPHALTRRLTNELARLEKLTSTPPSQGHLKQ